MPAKKGLGRGLDALLPGLETESDENVRLIATERIRPNPHQPRRHFDEAALAELAASIRQHGVLQPVILRKAGDGFELVAGERRWRASTRAGLTEIPAVVREFSDLQMMEIALIENLQREDLNPIEEASAYRRLLEVLQISQEQLAERLGKSRPAISNALRLLALDAGLQNQVAEGLLSAGHARALLAIENPERRQLLARRIVEEGLNVRATEELVRGLGQPAPAKARKSGRAPREAELEAVARRLREVLGAPVEIRRKGKAGKIEITFFGDDDLERLLEALGASEAKYA